MITKLKRVFWKKRNRKGALLIEVLLALVILSVSLTVVIRALINSQQLATQIESYTRSTWLMENKMYELTKKFYLVPDQQKNDLSSTENSDPLISFIDSKPWTGINDSGDLNKVAFEIAIDAKSKQKISLSLLFLKSPDE